MPDTGFVVEIQKKYKKSFCRASHLEPNERRRRSVRQRSPGRRQGLTLLLLKPQGKGQYPAPHAVPYRLKRG